jgi:hypothetical protein
MNRLIPNNILDKMSVADRKAIGQQTIEEATQAYHARIEREEDKIFHNYLLLNGCMFLRANPARKSTILPGWPDYTIFYEGAVFFVELKSKGKKLRPSQDEVCKQLTVSGFTVRVCYSAQEAIDRLKDWKRKRTKRPRINHCEECGKVIANDMYICLDCGRANQETEDSVNDYLNDRS